MFIYVFRPPKTGLCRENWLKVVKKNSCQPLGSFQVCNLHFKENQFKLSGNKIKLIDSAIPSIFANHGENMQHIVDKNNSKECCDMK